MAFDHKRPLRLRSYLNDIRSSHIGVIYEFRWTMFPVRRQPAANNDVDFDRETDKTKTDLDTESCVAAIDRTGSLRIRGGSCAESICSPHVTFCGRTHCASVHNACIVCPSLNARKTKVATVEQCGSPVNCETPTLDASKRRIINATLSIIS